jgi:hypothetical protein
MKFIITVDTEGDNQWQYNGCITLRNMHALPRFQKLCEQYGFVPTYLLAREVLQDAATVKALLERQKRGSAEIGVHLEPWTTPPFMAEETADPAMQAFPSELPLDWFSRKLEVLTAEVAERFGAPKSFRAARWGITGAMLRRLAEQGYTVDCSVTPKIDWRRQRGLAGGPGGPDYREAPPGPYRPSVKNVCRSGSAGLVEVPMTILYTARGAGENSVLAHRCTRLPESRLKRLLDRHLFRKRWLRVSHESLPDDWVRIYETALRGGLGVLQLMIHSSELMTGTSPLTRTEKDTAFVYESLTTMFRTFRQRGLQGESLSRFAAAVAVASGSAQEEGS